MRLLSRIIVETERSIEVGDDQAYNNWCDGRGGYTTLISIEIAAGVASIGAGAIYHWVENAKFHYQMTEAGLTRICERAFVEHLKRMNSLPKPKPGVPTY